MPYSTQQLADMFEAYDTWTGRLDELNTAIHLREYISVRGREFAIHGLSRRLSTLRHCLGRTFEHVPPSVETPSRLDLADASAFIQTFFINMYGSIDNLAHIWCQEAVVVDRQGRPLRDNNIGLMPKYNIVRESLSAKCQDYLTNSGDWFRYLEGYRHALAHRIPLYIPPRQLDSADQIRYREIEEEKLAALSAHQWSRFEELRHELELLGVFEPCIMHSYGEGAPLIRFHPQLVCDLATLVEIGEHIYCELDSLRD